jgi:anti-sigma regulatory factor (Ser/Thr protein kinase)
MTEQAEIRVQVMSNPLYLSGMREMIASVARRLGFSDEACGQMALAVDEALCNVIKHGYGKAHDRPIWIELTPLGGVTTPDVMHKQGNPVTGLKIVIEDEAKQVELDQIKGRKLEEIRPGGLGVHIIHEVMDQVKYEKRPGNGGVGMRLTMVKNRAAENGGGGGGGGGNGGGAGAAA